jgi:hypothetical protein
MEEFSWGYVSFDVNVFSDFFLIQKSKFFFQQCSIEEKIVDVFPKFCGAKLARDDVTYRIFEIC